MIYSNAIDSAKANIITTPWDQLTKETLVNAFSDSDNFQIIPGFIIFIIPFLLTSLALFGKSRKIMERNLDRLLML